MIKERNQIAQAFRSDGEGKKAVILGEMQRGVSWIQYVPAPTNKQRPSRAKLTQGPRLSTPTPMRALRISMNSGRQWNLIASFCRILEKLSQHNPNTSSISTTETENRIIVVLPMRYEKARYILRDASESLQL
jgi:hypothetical protein